MTEIAASANLPTRLDGLVTDARAIIDAARANAVRSVDFNRVMMYWNLGRRIFEEEQQGKDRAEYGERMIKGLAERLEAEYGSGFRVRQLESSRKFYRLYPIAHTLCAQLNWSQYKLLISLDDANKREYYQLEAVNNCWTKRELERQIHSRHGRQRFDLGHLAWRVHREDTRECIALAGRIRIVARPSVARAAPAEIAVRLGDAVTLAIALHDDRVRTLRGLESRAERQLRLDRILDRSKKFRTRLCPSLFAR